MSQRILRLRRAFAVLLCALPVCASAMVFGSATRLLPAVGGCALAAGEHHAALVIEHGNGAVLTVCVPFTGDSVTGEYLLQHSGIEYATAPYGTTGNAVCQVDFEPSSYPSGCWTASSPYWALYVSRGGGQWGFASQGVSTLAIRDGEAEGFRYEGQSDRSVPPSPAGVCPVATPPPAPVATPPPSAPAAVAPVGTGPAATGGNTATAQGTSPPPSAATQPGAAAASAVLGATAPPSAAGGIAGGITRLGTASAGAAPAPAPGPGTWAALALAVVLAGLLVVRGARGRRRPPA